MIGGISLGSFSQLHIVITFAMFAFWIVVNIFYILTLQKSLRAIDDDLRPLPAWLSWLYLIPVFNIIWIYFLVAGIASGYRKMFASGRLKKKVSAGLDVGMGFAVCLTIALIFHRATVVMLMISFALWVVHWIKVSRLPGQVLPA